ncbi:hypothetical protein [Psychroflexus aestuariivivens]|uniref:hypothetical protein n=1 Tax=Psychroflexus aestuariivivens TaxID=1795040 RepID=UPI000FDB2292|nr:hypothetical protein [Psychroflexus aestuariivivens]
MKTLNKSFKIYLAFLVLSIITTACCETNYKIIGSGTFTAYNIETDETFTESSGTITGEFILEVILDTRVVGSILNLDLMTSAYATSCGESFDNALDFSTLKLYTNKSFLLDGQVIEENSNLINLEDLNYIDNSAGFTIYFEDAFIERLEFSEEVYDFTFEIKTSDGLELENSLQLSFEIE